MKLELNELIIDNYYFFKRDSCEYILKYKGYDNENIFCEGYFLYRIDNIDFLYNKFDEVFCSIKTYYKDYKRSYQIKFKDIVDCLPDSNIDKIIYLRNKKINSLLNDHNK